MATPAETFANFAIVSVTQTAIDSLTFQKLDAGINMFSKIGWVVSRIEWYFGSNLTQLGSTGTDVTMALTQSNAISSLDPTEPGVLSRIRITRMDLGTAASGFYVVEPLIEDYSSLPGGGLIVLPNPIYVGITSTSAASALTGTGRIFYETVTLNDQDYFELLQMRQILQSG